MAEMCELALRPVSKCRGRSDGGFVARVCGRSWLAPDRHQSSANDRCRCTADVGWESL